MFQDRLRNKDIADWRTELAQNIEQSGNCGDRLLSNPSSIRVGVEKIIIPAPLSQELRYLAEAENVDLGIIFLGIFQVLLHRHTSDDEVPVGVMIPVEDKEGSTSRGDLVKPLVFRSKFSPKLTLSQLWQQILHNHSHFLQQATSIQDCYEGKQSKEEETPLNYPNPLRAAFSMEEMPLIKPSFSDLVLTQVTLNEPILPCDLVLSVRTEGEEITLKLLYDSNLFSADFAERISRHLLNALNATVEKPNCLVEKLPLMDQEEYQQLILEWSGTDADFPPEICLHQLFEAQVKRTPDACAVIHNQEQISYQALDQRANQLARYLQQFEVKPDTKVALYLDPSIELLITILAIWKAGAAYVPISPSMPRERVHFMLCDIQAPVLITKEPFINNDLAFPCQVIRLDADAAQIDGQPNTPPLHQATPDNLAYVIYTSGSTGEPKGVMVPHRGIANTLLRRQEAFPFHQTDRLLLTFSFVFDASIFQLFQPLLSGACLVIPEREHGGDPMRIINAIRRYQITVLGLNPSLLALLVKEQGFEQCDSVRMMFCGGESVSESLLEKINEVTGINVHNMYGPTEASMEATYWTYEPQMRVSIGRPIKNTRAYVLDEQLQPTPIGVPGELYLGGVGLAWGYLNQPQLTAEKFLPDPFSSVPSRRMYRTGDRCRWLPNGYLEYLGRQDEQVKLNGYRIELQEIEACLQKNTTVRENVVLLREDQPGDKRLVGYVVPKNIEQSNPEELRSYLRSHLPTYMIPSTFVFLESLPRTAGGKVNRRALKAHPLTPSSRRIADWSEQPLEAFLAGLWQEVLGLDGIGEGENFFELGGNSLRAAILAHKLEETLNEFVYPIVLYDAPTLEKLAHYLRLNYPQSVVRLFGQEALKGVESPRSSAITEASITTLRELIRPLPTRESIPDSPKNPEAIFILSPPRSGSTLLRIMLGGHPALFSPPELQLLNYNTLGERKAALSSERDNFWLQGTIQALMQIQGWSVEEATEKMQQLETENLSVKGFYRLMQEWLGEVKLVEKTPTYALDLQTLNRAEEDFENALYIHLIRHPSAAIASFEEAKLDVFFPPFFKGAHHFTVWQLAELVWTICHQNILDFLTTIPPERKHAVRFEDLVSNPKETMEKVAKFLDLPFHPNMINPYEQDRAAQMTDKIHSMARMLGDVKFHQHGQIKAEAAKRTYGRYPEEKLADVTRQLAGKLGYELYQPLDKSLVSLETRGESSPFFGVHPMASEVSYYQPLVNQLGSNQPFYVFRMQTLNGAATVPQSIPELAAAYVQELQTFQPEGPYRLGGWSFGGLVVFEMACQLAAKGEEIALLALFSSYIGEFRVEWPAPRFHDFLTGVFYEYGLDLGQIDVDHLSRVQFLELAFVQAKQSGVISPDLAFSDFYRVIRQNWRVYRRNVQLGRGYIPQTQLKHLVLFEAEDRSLDGHGPFENWERFATKVSYHEVPGNHFTMLREPNVSYLAASLKQYL
ncbi:amino acid adenylation domain protein [Rippkaea orientalis PCC 8801]|uniref:Amino acid adenylation domain protein n=1 Tax=Rippkaea orientalis (strain PCC 8801 / RF-1) TaxID=41431 RepID=B7JX33_RIPO1|nr:non-ribosomal peptide synthetase [Rippkaea orientalis]ACK65882.1 amino acid adenylation domain protein [Rippkaea orientalis PCC 8801]